MSGGIFKYPVTDSLHYTTEVCAPAGAKFMSVALPDENDGGVTPWAWMFVPDENAPLKSYKIKMYVTGSYNQEMMEEIRKMAFLARLDAKSVGITYRFHIFVDPDDVYVAAEPYPKMV